MACSSVPGCSHSKYDVMKHCSKNERRGKHTLPSDVQRSQEHPGVKQTSRSISILVLPGAQRQDAASLRSSQTALGEGGGRVG